MNLNEEKYKRWALVRDMLHATADIRDFRTKDLSEILGSLGRTQKLFLTGEGSSRIFPAKNCIYQAQRKGVPITLYSEGARQAAELELGDFCMIGASNSGKTKELISLFAMKKATRQYGLTAFKETPLESLSNDCFVLNCGKEGSVAATRSVMEQALFYQHLVALYAGSRIETGTLQELSAKMLSVLQAPVDGGMVSRLVRAPVIYFAGRNNGVAEEATLKTNEITRKKSEYLEGTYAVHGIEESMQPEEAVILVEPFEQEEEKVQEVLVRGVGMPVYAISARQTRFPTFTIPRMEGFDGFLQLAACWNILVEVGVALGIDLDTPARARKVGNEFKPESASH